MIIHTHIILIGMNWRHFYSLYEMCIYIQTDRHITLILFIRFAAPHTRKKEENTDITLDKMVVYSCLS